MTRIVEGHFHPTPQRTQIVRVEREHALLILFLRGADGTLAEERAEVPIAHAEALIDVAPGRVAFDRLPFVLTGGGRALIERFVVPNGLNLLRVSEPDPDSFDVPEWFGPEVTDRAELEKSALALGGAPELGEVAVSSRALESLLDTLDGFQSHGERSTMAIGQRPAFAVLEPGGDHHAHPKPDGREKTLKPATLPRGNVRELDDGIARFARSLAPRASRPT